jgi:fructokinase
MMIMKNAMSLVAGTATGNSMWVCGEVLIDRLPAPTSNNEGDYSGSSDDDDRRINIVGGGAANTAKCISRLGYKVEFIDGLSNDKYGQIAVSDLLNDNVGLDLCYLMTTTKDRSDNNNNNSSNMPTCLATVTLDKNKKASYEFLIDNTATFAFHKSWLPDFTIHKPSVLHIGTLATVIEPGATEIYNWAYEGIVLAASSSSSSSSEKKKNIIPIVYDPNIRPSVMSNDRNKYQKSVNKFASISTIIKASDDDIEWLYPNTSLEDVARNWLFSNSTTNTIMTNTMTNTTEGGERGGVTSLVVITKGADGMMSFTKKNDDNNNSDDLNMNMNMNMNIISIKPSIQIDVKDTVGAGDTVGAILVEAVVKYGIDTLVNEYDDACLRSVLERANKASGITCSRVGCKPPTQADLLS